MRLPSLLTIMALGMSLPLIAAPPGAEKRTAVSWQSPSSDPFPNKSIVVYVTDFDIGATDAPGTVRAAPNRKGPAPNAPSTAAATGAAPVTGAAATPSNAPATAANAADTPVADGDRSGALRPDAPAVDTQKLDTPKPDEPVDESPRAQAAKLVDLTSTTLVKVLQQAGYNVRRLRNPAARPESGVVIHGVFAQVDPNAGLRRVVLGGAVTDAKMLLFVGVGNLARPDQVLYQIVAGSQPTGNVGPLISVSAYAAVSRYELDRDPSEDQLKQTGEQISSDLTRLLNANPLAVGQ